MMDAKVLVKWMMSMVKPKTPKLPRSDPSCEDHTNAIDHMNRHYFSFRFQLFCFNSKWFCASLGIFRSKWGYWNQKSLRNWKKSQVAIVQNWRVMTGLLIICYPVKCQPSSKTGRPPCQAMAIVVEGYI